MNTGEFLRTYFEEHLQMAAFIQPQVCNSIKVETPAQILKDTFLMEHLQATASFPAGFPTFTRQYSSRLL